MFALPVADADSYLSLILRWFSSQMKYGGETPRPLSETVDAPWWNLIPWSEEAYRVRFTLTQPRDVWVLIKHTGPDRLRLEGISLLGKSVHRTVEGEGPVFPEDLFATLADRALDALARSIDEDDFSILHRILVSSGQSRFSVRDLEEKFAAFAESNYDLAPTVSPVLEQLPSVSKDGLVILTGHYPGDPDIHFELGFNQEADRWGLEGISLEVR